MEPIRVLYINGGIMSRGGIESYMMNYYRNIDHSKIQIDFVVHGNQKGVYDDEIKQLGGKIYQVPVKSEDYFGNIKALKAIFKGGQYKIVHSHMDAMSMLVLKIAKKCGVPVRIAHSHNTQHLTNNKLKYLLNEYARKNVNKYATHLFACSDKAGEWLFGKEATDQKKVTIIHNAIDLEMFIFNEAKRQNLIKKLGLENNFVVGHIGRFDYQKNHSFLIDIFDKVQELIPNAKLLLVGEGHLEESIKNKVSDLKLDEKVVFLGARNDVSELLNVFDLFLFPSLFEGLGIVIVEAQVNGLTCLTSTSVPSEVNITGNVNFYELNDNQEIWAEKIQDYIKYIHPQKKRIIKSELIKKSGYDIKHEVHILTEKYLELLKEV